MHYIPELLIQVIPATEDEFVQFEGTSESAAAMQGFDFSTVKIGRAGFFVDVTVTSTDLPPCDPEQPFPAGGPPVCEGEPTWVKFDCGAYGGAANHGRRLLVSVGAGGQQGDGLHLSGVLELCRRILDRRIH